MVWPMRCPPSGNSEPMSLRFCRKGDQAPPDGHILGPRRVPHCGRDFGGDGMYSDSDLDAAVAAGALSAEAATAFKDFVAGGRGLPAADEEHFRLLTGFNDIFVAIAIILVLLACAWLGNEANPLAGGAAAAAAAWGLAEYFTRRRRMALPSLVLLVGFVGAAGILGASAGGGLLGTLMGGTGALARPPTEAMVAAGAAAAVIAAFTHWRRFKVPITVAAGVGAGLATAVSAVLVLVPGATAVLMPMVLIGGLAVFALAMRWDASDRERRTGRSDVAFWLHLLAAPLIVHPVFTMLGLVGNSQATVASAAAAVAVYLGLGLVALAVDRRAVLVSALVYVLWATQALLRAAGSLSQNFALTALIIGAALLLLSAFWRPVRRLVVGRLGPAFRARLPAV